MSASSHFKVTLLGGEEGKSQEGSLEATPTSLIYTEAGSFTSYSWPVRQLKRVELRGRDQFVIEGRKMFSGTGTYVFQTYEARKIYEIVSQDATKEALMPAGLMDTPNATKNAVAMTTVVPAATSSSIPIANSSNQSDESGIVGSHSNGVQHWKLNTALSGDSSYNNSPVHHTPSVNHTPFSPPPFSPAPPKENCFSVERLLSDFKNTEPGTIEVAENSVVFTDITTGKAIQWPIAYLRRFGYENDIFTVETGRRCTGGPGLYNFRTPQAFELNAAVRMISSGDRSSLVSLSPSPTEVKVQPNSPPSLNATPTHNGGGVGGGGVPPLPPNRRAPMPPPPSSSSSPPSHSSQHKHQQQQQQPLPPLPGIPPGGFPPPMLTSPPPFATHSTNNQGISQQSPSGSNLSQQSSMRKAFSAMELRRKFFEVRNISDDKIEVGHGVVEVTETDLIYVDSKTGEKWKWPFKYLRKYGFKQDVFTFEAGRRCPGGQGLYAFASPRANEIHEAIVEGIRGGVRQLPQVLSASAVKGGVAGGGGGAVPSPPIQLANRNQYDIDLSPGRSKMAVGPRISLPGSSVTPPTPPPTSSMPIAANATHPSMVAPPTTSSSPPLSESIPSRTSPLLSNHTPSSKEATPPSTEGHAPSKSPPPPVNNATLSQYQDVELGQNPVKPVQRQHIYDVPKEYGSGNRLKIGNSASATPPQEGKKPLERKASSSPEHHVPSASAPTEGGVVTKTPTKKEKVSVLSRLIGRKGRSNSADPPAQLEGGVAAPTNTNKRSKKKNRKKSSSSTRSQNHNSSRSEMKGNLSDGEADVSTTSSTYQNLVEANLNKMAFSASCDDLLGSSMSGSYSSSISSVPQPRLWDDEAPPTPSNAMPIGHFRGGSYDQSDVSLSSSLYQNLDEAQRSLVESGSGVESSSSLSSMVPHPQDATPTSSANSDPSTTTPSPPLPLYTNVVLGDARKGGDGPSLTSPPPSATHQPYVQPETMYAVVDIIRPQKLPAGTKNSPKRHPKLVQHSSLTSMPVHHVRSGSSGVVDDPSGSASNSQAGTPNSKPRPQSDVDGGSVIYGRLDFAAMSVISKIRQEHEDTKNFESLLERHDLREEEMRRRFNN